MKQKYSLNVQIIPGERENFEISEKRFDREVQGADIMREVRPTNGRRAERGSTSLLLPPEARPGTTPPFFLEIADSRAACVEIVR